MFKVVRIGVLVCSLALTATTFVGIETAQAAVEKSGGSKSCSKGTVNVRANGSGQIRIYVNGSLMLYSDHGSLIYDSTYASGRVSISSWRVTSTGGYLSDSNTYAYCLSNAGLQAK